MNRRIFILGESTSSYMMHSIRDSLQRADFSVYLADSLFTMESIRDTEPDSLILFAGEYLDANRDALIRLQDYAINVNMQINVIGYKDEVQSACRVLKSELIKRIYERPLSIDDLVVQLNADMRTSEAAQDKKHILVVDDSGVSLRTIKSWLGNKYKVSVCSSAAMAITFLASQKPDLILLDYEMPICSGPQFLEMIRAEASTATIPIIFLTSKDDAESVNKVLSLKPNGYILKNQTPVQIIGAVDNFFEKQMS